jgi:hypothetical protein
MGDDLRYKPGDYYQIDQIRGYKVRASRTRMQWDGINTIDPSFSPRQPQDLVVGVVDIQTVPRPLPRQANQFTIVGTSVSAPAPAGSTSMQVLSTVGFNVGDLCQVTLDSGNIFQFTLGAVAGNTLSWSGSALPGSVGTLYGDPIENAVVDLTSVGGT